MAAQGQGDIRPTEVPSDPALKSDSVTDGNHRPGVGGNESRSNKRFNWFLFLTLLGSNLFTALAVAVPNPFLPGVAVRKGLSLATTGFLIGEYSLVDFLISPLVVYISAPVGSKFSITCGLFICGVCSVLFGLLEHCPTAASFGLLCFLTRGLGGFGAAFAIVLSYDIAARAFSDRLATVVGAFETAQGVGYTIGTALGGLLYDFGGFPLPFFTVGILLLVNAVSAYFICPVYQSKVEKTAHGSNFWTVFSVPIVLATVLSYSTFSALYGTLDALFSTYLTEAFHFTPKVIGMMFLLPGLMYSLSAILWGHLTDSRGWGVGLLLFGQISSAISIVMIDPPSFLFATTPSLYMVMPSLVILGLGSSAAMIPVYILCLKAAYKMGFDEGGDVMKFVAGVQKSVSSFGVFIGPTVGGRLYEVIGFDMILFGYGAVFLLCAILVSIASAIERRPPKSPAYSALPLECVDVDGNSVDDSNDDEV